MRKIFKHLTHIYRKLDVSPISPGGFSKELIIIFWGINAVFFLANGLTCDSGQNFSNHNYPSCTVTKKITKTDLYIEDTYIVNTSEHIIIPSYDSGIPLLDVKIVPSGRSPPL